MNNKILVEVCAGSLVDSVAAFNAGAGRIELNSAVELGGLSPSPGVLARVTGSVSIPVVAMVRPHPGCFFYSDSEKKAMLFDAELFLSLGAAGIAAGALLESGGIDVAFVRELRRLAGGTGELVFHRAFDLLSDLSASVSVLKDLGVDRILTSGGKRTAWDGRHMLKSLAETAGRHITILPGSGINSGNAVSLVNYTGCTSIHGSFSEGIRYPKSDAGVLPEKGLAVSPSEIGSVLRQFHQVLPCR